MVSTLYVLLSAGLLTTDAFVPSSQQSSLGRQHHSYKSHTTTSLHALSTVEPARQSLVDIAKRIRSEDGVIVKDSDAQTDLKQAVSELEAVSDPPSQQDYEKFFEGDWTLVCSTATTESPLKNAKLPFGIPNLLNEGPIADVRSSLDKRLTVKQRIRSTERIDNVLEFEPVDKIQDVLGGSDMMSNIPDALSSLNLNPLDVTETKVTLIHKSEVQSVTPVLRTKLGLQSIVLTIAGQSTYLEPDGADVLGINLPLGEFLNTGTFDTTYMDESLRISRGKVGLIDQLRVFVRADASSSVEEEEEEIVEVEEKAEEEGIVDEEVKMIEEAEEDVSASKEEETDDSDQSIQEKLLKARLNNNK